MYANGDSDSTMCTMISANMRDNLTTSCSIEQEHGRECNMKKICDRHNAISLLEGKQAQSTRVCQIDYIALV